jgi:hypothetical protein
LPVVREMQQMSIVGVYKIVTRPLGHTFYACETNNKSQIIFYVGYFRIRIYYNKLGTL